MSGVGCKSGSKPILRNSGVSECGAAVVETALLLAIIAIISVGSIKSVGLGVGYSFYQAQEQFNGGGTEVGPPPLPPS